MSRRVVLPCRLLSPWSLSSDIIIVVMSSAEQQALWWRCSPFHRGFTISSHDDGGCIRCMDAREGMFHRIPAKFCKILQVVENSHKVSQACLGPRSCTICSDILPSNIRIEFPQMNGPQRSQIPADMSIFREFSLLVFVVPKLAHACRDIAIHPRAEKHTDLCRYKNSCAWKLLIDVSKNYCNCPRETCGTGCPRWWKGQMCWVRASSLPQNGCPWWGSAFCTIHGTMLCCCLGGLFRLPSYQAVVAYWLVLTWSAPPNRGRLLATHRMPTVQVYMASVAWMPKRMKSPEPDGKTDLTVEMHKREWEWREVF